MAEDRIAEITLEVQGHMDSAIEVFKRDLAGIRTGRAAPGLVERVVVDYHGTPTPVNHLANVSAPEPQLLAIQPWDKTAIPAIEKAILKSELGLTPSNDGRIIRLPIPRLTDERRKELVKIVHKRAEESKVAVRNCRRDGVDQLHKGEKDKTISEDQSKRAQEQLQKTTDQHISEIERITAGKEKEILEV